MRQQPGLRIEQQRQMLRLAEFGVVARFAFEYEIKPDPIFGIAFVWLEHGWIPARLFAEQRADRVQIA